MRIFVATFYKNNYGSALQAFALQHKLKQLGADVSLIEPKNVKVKEKNIIKKLFLFFRPEKHYGPFRKVRRYIQRKIYIDKYKKINDFIENNIKTIELDDCISEINKENSVLLAGSDQIWSILNHPIDGFYLFDFINSKNVKKVSYAASIGVSTLDVSQKKYFRKALQSFDAVSFRERNAYETLKNELSNPVVRQDLDPTLLHTGKFWASVAGKRQYNRSYVFIYMLRPSNQVVRVAKRIAKKYNLDILYTGLYVNHYLGIKTIADIGVEEFLSYILNADYVVTNSFHGTVFSILFGKKFFSVKISSTSSRVENLLDIVGLSRFLISDVSDIDMVEAEYNVDYVNERLSEERNKSLKYLKKIVEGCDWRNAN